MHITIVGGGFGGVKAALKLAKNKRVKITLISDKTDFQYYPGLYSTATGRSHLQSWIPLGEIFAGHDNIQVVIDTVINIDKKAKTVSGASGAVYSYHSLILSLGSVTTYFGIKGLDHYAYGIKSMVEINRLKQHLLDEFSRSDGADKDFLVIGAGPTGVELVSALGTYLNHLKKHFNKPEPRMKISIIEAGPRVLPKMSEASSKLVHKRLKALGVHVELNKRVEEETADLLIVNGKPIKSHTVIWTSGVANNPFYDANASQFEFSNNHKIVVNRYLESSKDVYVIGDNAFTPYCGLAQTALKDGAFVAHHILTKSKNKYSAKIPVMIVPVGNDWAILEYKKIHVAGRIGSSIRSVADLIGYNEILPFGQAFSVWSAQSVKEDTYFPAKLSKK